MFPRTDKAVGLQKINTKFLEKSQDPVEIIFGLWLSK
jgi:hypothetical protein